MCTAPGRIQFPDDEIVFQTTASLVDRGSLAITGIPWRTGEPKGRPDGTFGWAEGQDGQRYGFFGHGLSLVAAPVYALARASAPVVPFAWTRAVRSDHLTFHRRDPRADWTRTMVSLTNCVITAGTAWALVRWLAWVGLSGRAALWSGVAFATATVAWPYARTFLSEPLSALVLLIAAIAIAQAHALRAADPGKADRRLWLAGAAAGFGVHVHVLNVTAWPVLAGYALAPAIVRWRRGRRGQGPRDRFVKACRKELARARRGWVGAIALAGVGLGALLLGQWWRFGDPLETGRYGIYSAWTAPWTGLWAQMVAPGRSFWLYSPAAALGLLGARAALRGMSAGTCESEVSAGTGEGTGGEVSGGTGEDEVSGGTGEGEGHGMSAGTGEDGMSAGTGEWGRAQAIAAGAWFALAVLVTRWVFVSARTDWYGGWSVGSRYLVPAIPLVMIGFAAAVEGLPRRARWVRGLFWGGLAAGVLVTAHLATHSIFEWMLAVIADPRVADGTYREVSHFEPWASPIAGFVQLQPDVLALGAVKLARVGHPGLLAVFGAIALAGVAAGGAVARALWRQRVRGR